ncbi:hypothetical protein CSW59_13435 [Caulobacter sp. BP25]|nr:hypothetical protein CSW59_13435 [Caulobacter sp. BP25]
MPQRPFDLREDSIFEPFPKWWGLLIIGLSAPLLLIFDRLGLPAVGQLAWTSTAAIGFAVRTYWPLRREPWFWATIACTIAVHAMAIVLWPWPKQSYPAWITGLSLGADIAFVVGVVALVATSIRCASKAD